MKVNPDHLEILRKINSKPNYTQRELAKELGFSLGKLNYCINALKNKGLVRIYTDKNSFIGLGLVGNNNMIQPKRLLATN